MCDDANVWLIQVLSMCGEANVWLIQVLYMCGANVWLIQVLYMCDNANVWLTQVLYMCDANVWLIQVLYMCDDANVWLIQVLSLDVQEKLGIDGLQKLQVPLHMHCGELSLPALTAHGQTLQSNRKRRLVLQVPPPMPFQFSLEALELGHYLEQRLKTGKFLCAELKPRKVRDKGSSCAGAATTAAQSNVSSFQEDSSLQSSVQRSTPLLLINQSTSGSSLQSIAPLPSASLPTRWPHLSTVSVASSRLFSTGEYSHFTSCTFGPIHARPEQKRKTKKKPKKTPKQN